MEKQPTVYLMANKRNGTLYLGVTNNLPVSVWRRKTGEAGGFTKKYNVHTLVYFEHHEDVPAAVARGKQIKKWRRQRKVELIEGKNPQWRDLYEDIV